MGRCGLGYVQAEFASGKQLHPEVALVAGPPLAWWRKWWKRMSLGKSPTARD